LLGHHARRGALLLAHPGQTVPVIHYYPAGP
jgi:hypothetical protein